MASMYLVRNGCKIPITLPHADTEAGVANDLPCPFCCAMPLLVAGGGLSPSADGRASEAAAFSLCCGEVVGRLRYEPSARDRAATDLPILRGWRSWIERRRMPSHFQPLARAAHGGVEEPPASETRPLSPDRSPSAPSGRPPAYSTVNALAEVGVSSVADPQREGRRPA